MTLGERTKIERAARGWTQQKLADQAGMDQPSLHKLESRKSRNSKHAPAIARALDVNLEWLLTGAGQKQSLQAATHAAAAEYKSDPAMIHAMRRATRDFMELCGFELIKEKGPEWAADIIYMLFELYQDPVSTELNKKTILKLINTRESNYYAPEKSTN